jgi:phenylpyruvate tautomerase PptA (4-oxalocrotonate tautomerase family)
VTVAEKIGKQHLTYAQGAAAELVAAVTIGLADVFHMPVSTTHVLSSGVAGTMWANRSGIQGETVRKIGLAWVLTLPAAITLSASLFSVGGLLIPAARPQAVAARPATASPTAAVASSPFTAFGHQAHGQPRITSTAAGAVPTALRRIRRRSRLGPSAESVPAP